MNAPSDELREKLGAHVKPLWRYGLALSSNGDAAEELVQATCIRALERAHQFTAGTRLDCWLFAILHSIWINELRSRRIRRGTGSVDPKDLTFDGGALIEANVWARQVLTKVQSLPKTQRQTVHLVYVEGLSYREAADLLVIPVGTVMSRLAAARLTLGKLAGKE